MQACQHENDTCKEPKFAAARGNFLNRTFAQQQQRKQKQPTTMEPKPTSTPPNSCSSCSSSPSASAASTASSHHDVINNKDDDDVISPSRHEVVNITTQSEVEDFLKRNPNFLKDFVIKTVSGQ